MKEKLENWNYLLSKILNYDSSHVMETGEPILSVEENYDLCELKNFLETCISLAQIYKSFSDGKKVLDK